jgi:uncharacterized protein YjbJ (UPF0337 family)
MNKEIIKGNWKQLKGKLKQQWGKFTDDDIATMEGNYEELEGLLQKRYGYAADKAETEINTFIEKNKIKETTY